MIQENQNKYVKDQQEITRLKRIIERHEAKIEILREKGWGDVLITPIMEAIRVEFPELKWDEKMATMGFGCRVPMFGKDDTGKMIVCITFVPKDLTKGEIGFENGEYINKHQKNSMGDVHGFNNVVEIINDIEQVFNHIRPQLNLVESE